MSGRNVAWTTAAATGFLCAILSASASWVLLTQPLAITTTINAQDVGTLVHALLAALIRVAAVLRLL